MKNIYKILLIISIGVASMLGYYFFNVMILYPLLIPDECYYHMHETPFLVDVFFDFPSSEGNHPVPSTLGYLLFGIVGAWIGYKIPKG